MVDRIKIEKMNEVHMKVIADSSTLQELSEFFAFRPNNYQFSPKFKAKLWDGYIRLITPFRPFLYIGLLHFMKDFAETREYELEIDPELEDLEDVPDDYGYDLAKEVGIPYDLYDYQNDYIVHCLRHRRTLSLSPTSSGKSLMIYLLQQFYYRGFQHRTLIIVPTISLLHQMASDFVDYGCDSNDIYKIQSGVDKNVDYPITISTWQSIQRMPKEWFDQFQVVVGDEAHLFTGKSLSGIMEKCFEAKYRFGFTGTISSDSKTHRMVLQGLFGEIRKFVTTKDLIDTKRVASFKIKAIILNHPQEIRKAFKDSVSKIQKEKRYHAEREFIINSERRNLFIRNLVWSLEGQNNLILFELVEKHGKILEPLLRKEGRELHFLHGGVSGEERERIRHLIENDNEILIQLHFGSQMIECKENEEVPLSDGTMVKAKEVNEHHDVSDLWIQARLKE